ncbi:hypothetical protein EIN_043970 [Entamoeba invadens IP1]|uniref:PiggyBac transposable element-derived protein domain-containing protein n=1 Tax=Entamoeba invadens IP1 TaxID=370355 RepID=A0A0A1TZ75_ENTIV|nr:hypothetical protein EIN_043970 [Entamoeba invadens IP1]ELP86849.1 hypothetical protein EIN_043970 [Entamoeba invadens IP1]|eukprot:XP_004253620.1 hypothetical protein EIN_043970 [Entamoeba invadens IP1]
MEVDKVYTKKVEKKNENKSYGDYTHISELQDEVLNEELITNTQQWVDIVKATQNSESDSSSEEIEKEDENLVLEDEDENVNEESGLLDEESCVFDNKHYFLVSTFFEIFISNMRSYTKNNSLQSLFCIDEQLVKYFGHCKFTQFIPTKPGKYGMKVWTMVDNISGLVCNSELYLGSVAGNEENYIENLVIKMIDTLILPDFLVGNQTTLYIDNLFTTVDLAVRLKQRNNDVVGTCHKNRTFVPSICREIKPYKSFICLLLVKQAATDEPPTHPPF